MKKYIVFIACTLTIMWGCNSNENDSHARHNHDHPAGHTHGEEDHGKKETDDHAHEEVIVITSEQAKTIGLELEEVKGRTFHQVIKTSGQVLAAQGDERTIVASTNGIVSLTKAATNEGSVVRKGETLFRISSSGMVEGDPVVKAKAAYQIAKGEFERAESLIADKLISQKEYNEIKLIYENARISYQGFSSGSGANGSGIISPINGYVKARLVEEGQYVSVGEILMVVTQNNKLQLKADVSERNYGELSTINSANFKTPYNNTIYKLSDMGGQLLSYGRSSSATEFFIPVNFQFNNVGQIIPGSYVEVFLLSATRPNVITIPLSSLTDEQGIHFVYVHLHDGEYERREVKLGVDDGERVEVLSGIKLGEEVVCKGAYHVKLAAATEAIPHSHEH